MTHKWEILSRIVSQVGFPIVVTAFLLYRFDTTIASLADRLAQVAQSIVILTSEQRSTNDLLRERIRQSQDSERDTKTYRDEERKGR